MQTFLPYPDFKRSAETLDYRRLGKQRIECATILNGGWPNHPAAKMWSKNRYQLAEYGKVICLVWRAKGYKDTQLEVIEAVQATLEDNGLPTWFGDPAFHLSHQSNLIRKKPEHYASQFPGVPADLPYIWPI
jgi:Pyrimidine dimer DNA glycosylase